MLNKIIQFSVRNKIAIGTLMLVWIAWGSYQLTKLPIDAVPDITNNQVQVITTAPSLSAEDVERFITFPIEQALSNIPGLHENRSISRFGLSVITVVFDDEVDIYRARQQVSERLSQVKIDVDANLPQMAPVTTGLGEIYQYVLKPKDGYDHKFSLSDLRTIQDWIVRRQLLGTPGVAEVSTFGGELKQYEVAVQPNNLKAFNLTVGDVFNALSRNNQNTGGAYIEKGPSVLYIRSMGLVGSMDDIRNIVVKNSSDGTPILIRHVADIRQGSAIRYGALTMTGKGELAGGIVMMLKGANSSDVIGEVKKRITAIQKTLPEGLVIEPFLDRTKMVNNAIGTVETNLLEGALIVILVLVLFLGNLRAGLIVASVIPLSMLFAVSMMNLFGVSGNLMSLGALDFGLIVDGAVIIVEAILHRIHIPGKYAAGARIDKTEMEHEVATAASRMMNAAVFGQIIILIVYLPILSLSGIEGKMFKPMAQTVIFAVAGAFILSLTYVPAVSALFVSRKVTGKPTLSDRVMARMEAFYAKSLAAVLRFKKATVSVAIVLFGIALFIFMQMGGEFIPQLEEGDFAVETRLLVGTNLSTTVSTFNRITNRLKHDYPEVEKIVSRIGSSEIPTDPMPVESGDMIIILKDKSQWKSAATFTELAEKMSVTVQEVAPGVTTGFQYPVQMRFNELMTGAKQDVVCKIYGEDLDKLSAYADKLGSIVKTVKGTTDLYIEKVTGMPQIVIDYNRAEIARYGLNIEDVNRTVSSAFAGATAGQLYESEKRFDIVVRTGAEGRSDITDVANLQVATPSGTQIPLYQVATIKEIEGPNQIQREQARRRIIVGFNVRGRDVESIVKELAGKVNNNMKMDAGYNVTYGGTFENLQQAKSRLSIAVPVALLLIFIMLYFAFSSVRDGLLIYTAIPLSAIGGVYALASRGMPFSISAGVGFIALFGVAVLNGIVLLSEFRRIAAAGQITDTLQLVITGTRNRLRPVLMTAAVASLGFLPMALSNGAGAEVQRPLATVVIGGLITATLLTLFVLPALYLLFNSRKMKLPLTALLLLLLPAAANAQTKPIDLAAALQVAERNNLRMQVSRLDEHAKATQRHTAYDIAKTTIDADYGQVNSINSDTRFGISQDFSFPTVYANKRKMLLAEYEAARANVRITKQQLTADVRRAFYDYLQLTARLRILQFADSLYNLFETRSTLRFQKGAANILEKTTAAARRQQVANQLSMLRSDMDIALMQFNFLLHDSGTYTPMGEASLAYSITGAEAAGVEVAPSVQLARQQERAANFLWKTEKARMLPDLKIGYSNQSLTGVQQVGGKEVYFGSGYRFDYVSAGITVPVFYRSFAAKAALAKTEWERSRTHADYLAGELAVARSKAAQQVAKTKKSLRYFEQQGLANADTIITAAGQQLNAGEIDYLQWVMLVDQALTIRTEYTNALENYNNAVISFLQLNDQ